MESFKYSVNSLMHEREVVEVVVVVSGSVLFVGTRAILLALISYWSAMAVNSFAAMALALPLSAPYSHAQPILQKPKGQLPFSSYAVIAQRDIFHSVKAPDSASPSARTVSSGSTGPLKLWGTAVHGETPAFAILEDQKTHVQGLHREGAEISPGVILAKVEWDRVIVARDGRQETLLLPTDATRPSASKPSASLRLQLQQPKVGGIQQISEDVYQVDRNEIEHAMENLGNLFTKVRAVPYASDDGEINGFRLVSIKAKSLVDRLGLKNGDIVRRVNGVDIADPSTAFSLLQDLPGLSQVSVDVVRNHQPVTLSYKIQ